MAASDQQNLGFPSHLWVVKGKAYDLTDYLPSHPGGKDWLEFTRGMDITDLFIIHHLDEKKAEAVLGKYFVQDVKNPGANDRYTYKEDGLYRTAKRKVVAVLKGSKGSKANRKMRVATVLVLAAWMAVMGLAATSKAWEQGVWWILIAGLLLHSLFGIGHNYMHQGPSWGRYLVDFTFFSSWEWRLSHCISHHTFPNLDVDVEMEMLEPFIFSLVTRPANPVLLPLYVLAIFGLTCYVELLARLVGIVMGKQKLRPENLLPLAQLAVLVWGQGWNRGLGLFAILHIIPGVLVGLTSIILHHSDYSWSEGKHGGVLDYAEHTFMATTDYNTDMPFLASLIFCGLFNDHTAHHLFPTVDESRLPEIKPLVREAFRELKLPYCHPYRYTDLLLGTLRTFTKRDKAKPTTRRPHPSLAHKVEPQ